MHPGLDLSWELDRFSNPPCLSSDPCSFMILPTISLLNQALLRSLIFIILYIPLMVEPLKSLIWFKAVNQWCWSGNANYNHNITASTFFVCFNTGCYFQSAKCNVPLWTHVSTGDSQTHVTTSRTSHPCSPPSCSALCLSSAACDLKCFL